MLLIVAGRLCLLSGTMKTGDDLPMRFEADSPNAGIHSIFQSLIHAYDI